MPTRLAICMHWFEWMVENGKAKPFEPPNRIACRRCMACGLDTENLERAHITAVSCGGGNEANNLHNLCPLCHKRSELIDNRDDYMSWAMRRTPNDALSDIGGYDRLVSKSVGSRTRAAMAKKKLRGERISGQAPFGYRFDDKGISSPNEEERDTYEYVAKMSDNGWTQQQIAESLARRGVVNRNGKPITRRMVGKILTCGLCVVVDSREQSILTEIHRLRRNGLSFQQIADKLARRGVMTRTGRPYSSQGIGHLYRTANLADSETSSGESQCLDHG